MNQFTFSTKRPGDTLFETIEELRQALLAFRETYNATWLIKRHGYLTPEQFRQPRLQPIATVA